MAVGLAAMPATTQSALQVDVIKQYGGLVTIQRRVKVKVPGKHFPQLQAAEQKVQRRQQSTREPTQLRRPPPPRPPWRACDFSPVCHLVLVSDSV